MSGSNKITKMARELLMINEDFPFRFIQHRITRPVTSTSPGGTLIQLLATQLLGQTSCRRKMASVSEAAARYRSAEDE